MTTTIDSPRMTRAAAARHVRSRLAWDRDPPEQERVTAIREARHLLHRMTTDRVGLLRVLDALDRCPLAALAELQALAPFANEPAGLVTIELFEAFLFGPLSGGTGGVYGRAYLAELRAVAAYVRSIH